MGFLDNSTNNIILDAVLTDKGRKLLAENNGSFSIFKFALGDDEVDYNVIKKFGRTVGREKIEKNTPIFEALTNDAYAQKRRLVTVSNPYLIRMPKLVLTTGGTSDKVSMSTASTGSGKSASLTLEQSIVNETKLDVELVDQAFTVSMSNIFLEVSGKTPSSVNGQQIATYYVTKTGEKDTGAVVNFTVNLKSLTSSLFQVYGYNGKITTYIRVSGINSGVSKDIKVEISQ